MWLWYGLFCTVGACVRHMKEKVVFFLNCQWPDWARAKKEGERTKAWPLPKLIEVCLTLDLMDKTNKQTKGAPSFCLFIIISPSMQFD